MDDRCFIFLTHITTVNRAMVFARPLILYENSLNHNYHINIYTFN